MNTSWDGEKTHGYHRYVVLYRSHHHTKVLADNPSWDGEKTVVITCRYVVLYRSHHHTHQGHGGQPVLVRRENCRYHRYVVLYRSHHQTHAKVMADNPSWDREKTVVITCRYVLLYSSHHHACQGHGRQPVLGRGENCRYHLQVCSVMM